MIGLIAAFAALLFIIGITIKADLMRQKAEEKRWDSHKQSRIVEYIEEIDALFDTKSGRFELVYEKELRKDHKIEIYRDVNTKKYIQLTRYVNYDTPGHMLEIKSKKTVLAHITGKLENEKEKIKLYKILSEE